MKARFLSLMFLLLAGQHAVAYDADASIDYLLPDYDLPYYFTDSFNDLMEKDWHDDGNWGRDWQNDATAFAPELLYSLDQVISESPGPFYDRAVRTASWESKEIQQAYNLVLAILSGEREANSFAERAIFDTAVGTYSYLSCARYAQGLQDDLCRWMMSPIISLANLAFLTPVFEWLGLFEGQEATLYSRLAFINAEYFRVTGKQKYRDAAVALLSRMEHEADPDGDGIYEGSIFGWSQASPLAAYATLYEVTGDTTFLDHAERIIQAMDQDYLFGVPGETEAYWEVEHNSLGSDETTLALASSTHAQFLEAFTTLALSTRDPSYIERAERFLEFAVRHMYLPNLGEADPHFVHDIDWPVEQANPYSPQFEYNPAFCTGESFNFLRITWKLIELRRELVQP